jgi:hypothetical protein
VFIPCSSRPQAFFGCSFSIGSLALLALLLGGFSAPALATPILTNPLPFGRWRGESTAGMAVLDVLTLTPERVRWGNAYNGRCDRAYNVEELPSGQVTYPDNLVPPASPTDLRFRVVRLRLQPGPCGRDAKVQLAIPLDGSDRMFVNSYAADGSLTGWYGELNRLP